MIPALHADTVLLPTGWEKDVLFTLDPAGNIASAEIGADPMEALRAGGRRLRGHTVPGIPNLHSHAFQRAMAGLGERRSPAEAGRDSFWTWRDTMYRFVSRFRPEDAEAVASMLYAELLSYGFTSVAEFHYLHHQPDGTPYATPAEMALRHLEAARRTGIGITLLPSLYRFGGIFGREPVPGQRRFLNDLFGFGRILENCREATRGDGQATTGIAPHSLRAVTPDMLQALSDHEGPIHIHAAEQTREVEECLAATGARPVEWLLLNAPLDRRWCLIHCTHLTSAESEALAHTGAVAGLCPTTEASLGDGVFDLATWLSAGGRYGIGTDSHVGTAPREELRLLETTQRLALRERAVATDEDHPHPGRNLLDLALAGGAQAVGRPVGALTPGQRGDFVELDGEDLALYGREGDALLDSWIFSGQTNPVRTVIVGGRAVVEGGQHVEAGAIARDYRAAINRLRD